MKKILLSMLSLFCVAATAQPIRIIVPFASGGQGDLLARLVQKTLVQDLNKDVVVEIKPGASAEIGTAYVANSTSKDLILLVNGPSILINRVIKGPANYNEKNLVPLITTGYVPFVLVVSKKSGIKSFKDFQEIDSSRRIAYGSSGTGSATHLAFEVLNQEINKNLIHIPYKGFGASLTDLISGNIDALFAHWPAVMPYILSGQVTALAIESPTRIAKLPDVPTLKEFNISYSSREGWNLWWVNANSDPALRDLVKKSILKMMESQKDSGEYSDLGLRYDEDPLAVQDFLDKERQKYHKLLQKIKLD